MVEKAMTLLTHRHEGPAFSYAGQLMHILAGNGGQPPGFAAMEITIPPHFAGLLLLPDPPVRRALAAYTRTSPDPIASAFLDILASEAPIMPAHVRRRLGLS